MSQEKTQNRILAEQIADALFDANGTEATRLLLVRDRRPGDWYDFEKLSGWGKQPAIDQIEKVIKDFKEKQS
jgi:hypothetical protein